MSTTHVKIQNNTVSQDEQLLAKNHHQYLKCLHLSQTNNYIPKPSQVKVNQLPINLFLSPTEYHKIIITKGKSRKCNNNSHIADGEILSLQYHNDPIFQKQLLKKSIPTHTNKPELNQSSHTQKNIKSINLSNDKKKNLQYQQFFNHRKRSHSAKQKRRNSQIITNSRKTNGSEVNKRRFKKSVMMMDDSSRWSNSRRTKSQNSADITHLIIKSLIDFTEKKKAQQQLEASIKRNTHVKSNHLKQLNEQIRTYNYYNLEKQSKSKTKSKSRSKSFTKKQLALDYWDHIKDQVLNSLKNDNYSHHLKEHLKNYQFNVYDHKDIPQRKLRFSEKQIQMMALQHEKEVNSMIKCQKRQKRAASEKIKKNLRGLQNERKRKIQQTLKKPFKPTAQMIRSAFQNILQPNHPYDVEPYQQNVGSMFRNQRIKVVSSNSLKRANN